MRRGASAAAAVWCRKTDAMPCNLYMCINIFCRPFICVFFVSTELALQIPSSLKLETCRARQSLMVRSTTRERWESKALMGLDLDLAVCPSYLTPVDDKDWRCDFMLIYAVSPPSTSRMLHSSLLCYTPHRRQIDPHRLHTHARILARSPAPPSISLTRLSFVSLNTWQQIRSENCSEMQPFGWRRASGTACWDRTDEASRLF